MMNPSKMIFVLSALIVMLSLFATGVGILWQGQGMPFAFRTLRGETVTIQGSGLYQFDSVSYAAQAIAQDVVTLLLGIPLLSLSMFWYRQGTLRSKLLLTGTLGYFLYTYTSYAFLMAYNSLFLVYTALFSLSLFAFIFTLRTIEVSELPAHFSARLPRRGIAAFLFLVGAFLLLAWLGRILPAIPNGSIPVGLESATTLVIQALDLGIIAPIAFLAGVLLLQQKPYGYLLTSIMLIKGCTMLIAITAMIIGQLLVGAPMNPVEIWVFPLFAVIGIVLTVVLLKHVRE
jgi:hypothetical protein